MAKTLEDRVRRRQDELEDAMDSRDIFVPELPDGRPPGPKAPMLEPEQNAAAGELDCNRNIWIAKYDPYRAATDTDVASSDVFSDYLWDSPIDAIGDPWIHTEWMRGVSSSIPDISIGDLVIAMRTRWFLDDGSWIKRRCLVGLWWVESISAWPSRAKSGSIRTEYDVACIPLKRFDFPVPIVATSQQDAEFAKTNAFTDRARRSFLRVTQDEVASVIRNCGLPAEVLTEQNPGSLTAMLSKLDLGPPSTVRRRIREGARAAAHRRSVEDAGRDVAVSSLASRRFAVVSTEKERGLGSDLWAKALEGDGSILEVRIEVKGLSGSNPWNARLTRSELEAAQNARGSGSWWLVIVTHALRVDRAEHWLSADEVARIFTVEGSDHFTANPELAKRL